MYKFSSHHCFRNQIPLAVLPCFNALELHVIPPHVPCTGSRYRIFTQLGNLVGLRQGDQGTKECRYFENVGEALEAYTALYDQHLYSLTRVESTLSQKIGSDKMQMTACSSFEDSAISLEVANLIDSIWNEATGSLTDILAVPVDSIKLEDVEKAEAILLLLRKSLDADEGFSAINKLSDEFFSVIPHKNRGRGITSRHLIAQKQDLCQLIKDMVSIDESTNWSTRSSVYGKYRALKTHIECLKHDSSEFRTIQELVSASETGPSKIDVLNVFSIHRPVEEGSFSHDIGNKTLLFHSSKLTNFVGILLRGLLMPKIVVDDFGGQRSDAGMLGSGIYFASSASTSAKYSAPGSKGTRLMLVNEVALGSIKEFRTFSMELTSPPRGYNSCHGLMSTEDEPSEFKDDEYAIYSGNQQKIRYLVEFVLPGDKVLPRDDISLDSGFSDYEIEDVPEDTSVDLTDVMSVVDPLTKVEAGLKGTGDKPIPLQSVHIRARLLDLAAQVIVFQAYKNTSTTPIEAKYVFPLDDMAAVCGFEAFINGKHIVGEVKEKEQAHKEYREAISQGHGAYLMDEETPDVFTVSVGNLPPGAQVFIKITYVTELMVDREHICFSLPGSVAPWTRDKALEEVTQTDVDTVTIDDNLPKELYDVSVEMSVEMPFEIRSLESPSHVIRTKRTATKAVVLLERGQPLGDGFQLLIGLAEIHVPRMWVERHVSKPDSQACMLTFYPEFEAETPPEVEVVFLLDLSCSMKGSPFEEAKKILLMCLSHMKKDWTFNILVFGSISSQ
ncbi:Protein mono-ADP-ribosyltransferase parp4 [Desmophyllum pertusum]|uniref:Poly [ADP-ribose] polymerase n=1 Tax=Desmophyllum pertusum TaxID=174260 RepID=A0A9X0D9E4_9CNID|nr:Protein mono-ADP-ribosyltransferase parp4 [Desmophyllum pertusum]